MLKTRVMTALLLLAVLLPILFLNNFPALVLVSVLFFGAAIWESARLFANGKPLLIAAIASLIYALVIFVIPLPGTRMLFALCLALWGLRFAPALGLGLPPLHSTASQLLSVTYGMAIFGCFIAIIALFHHAPLYLLSVMAVVWVADIGAYFTGKACGRHKLAPSISPGKSWEGVCGGWLLVMLLAALTVVSPTLSDTFPALLQRRWGWLVMLLVMSVAVAASVVGDLFESLLKRRAQVKDSSQLLPGHGGVLDRIDALIPVLPLAALLSLWL